MTEGKESISNIDPDVLSGILLHLYKESLSYDGSKNAVKTIIDLGELEYEQDTKSGLKALNYLKGEGLIKGFKELECKIVPVDDLDEIDIEQGITSEYIEYVRMECKFVPDKKRIAGYIEESWKDTKKNIKELLNHYLKLIGFIYKNKNLKIKNFDIDEEYKKILSELDILTNNLKMNGLFIKCYIPYKTIFSAEEVIKKEKISKSIITDRMHKCYRELVEIARHYELDGNVDKYLKNINFANIKDKKVIYVSENDGIYDDQIGKRDGYGITGDRMELVKILCKNKRVGIKELKNLLNKKDQYFLDAIPKINNIFRRKLNLGNKAQDLIVSAATGGYELNRDSYDIKIYP